MIAWILFNVFILAMLLLDLGVFHRKEHAVSFREALFWSGMWIFLALAFNVGIYFMMGSEAAFNFLTGYLIEESLSVDNLFVFLLIFSYFKVQEEYLHKVLFWGVLGAIVFRIIFIFAGITLIDRFHWVTYVFGLFLVYTGFRLGVKKGNDIHPDQNFLIVNLKKWMAITPNYHNGHFFIKEGRRLVATPLFLVLITVEITDIIFAIDSVPAVLAITTDPFIVYTSNVFAILGLRSLYFALSGTMKLFYYLHYGLALLLIFIGMKMVLVDVVKIPIFAALGIIIMILLGSILASIFFPPRDIPKSS